MLSKVSSLKPNKFINHTIGSHYRLILKELIFLASLHGMLAETVEPLCQGFVAFFSARITLYSIQESFKHHFKSKLGI